ncbi:MAG: 4-hydroxy-2-oxovalerate aldolase [Candidatus Omnitrophica bacterium CG11_big_fil_rev_8_21_14_0_20_45_26]|uniref:4-hydroxy-2-oxovalerate aldolase n=1 Tax=Candidatus Abzuiibacterium crystallinum TaxID=1974748 RepID=A0A2H0LLK4_9BACT|nr:MAG: 4-hydroxy-2-oxovalerate aldolase [Candidatus Omnitrophica bacterium CG11_big_fil_rev_8_21_14_0_20_45_26]PIW64534.1 MAG: 4-hydroxy-2-oxovalerate aldolase [Candidatus Omnitrophica bacterium CG12_big_fil_rev_8_21_14_0_65_45_16]
MSNQKPVRFNLKQKLRNRERVFGTWASLFHPSIAEIFGEMGADFLGLDLEHGTMSHGDAQTMILASQSKNVPCLPRIASHNIEMGRRLLDSGADGLIIPMVNTAKQASDLVTAYKYPPLGHRGYGVARAQGYGFSFSEYAKTWNDSSTFIVQIESIKAMEHIDEILKLDLIDGVMVGPYDISGSLGIPGELEHPRVQETVNQIIQACQTHGKSCGTQLVDPDTEQLDQAFKAGFTFVILSSDVFLLWKWSERMKGLLHPSVPQRV